MNTQHSRLVLAGNVIGRALFVASVSICTLQALRGDWYEVVQWVLVWLGLVLAAQASTRPS